MAVVLLVAADFSVLAALAAEDCDRGCPAAVCPHRHRQSCWLQNLELKEPRRPDGCVLAEAKALAAVAVVEPDRLPAVWEAAAVVPDPAVVGPEAAVEQ